MKFLNFHLFSQFSSIFSIFTVFLISGCTSVPQKLDGKIFYKRDMIIKVNDYKAEGVLVVPRSSRYKFDIKARGRLDLFTFTTCHREQTKENAGEQGWFSDKSRRQLTYRPVPIERAALICPIQLGGFERIKGRHSWGFVTFEHPSLRLQGMVSCNGLHYNAHGVSACQTKAGLIMEIKFAEKVLPPAPKDSCVALTSKDGMTYQFKVPKGECSFRFMAIKGEKERMHRLTTLGYEKILIREN